MVIPTIFKLTNKVFHIFCVLNPLHIFPTVHLPLYLCFSIVTTAVSLYRTCFVLAKAEKLKEELTNCLYFGLEFQFLWGRRISEFGLKQRLSSSSSLVKSHRKGNCTHNHYLSYHNKLSY